MRRKEGWKEGRKKVSEGRKVRRLRNSIDLEFDHKSLKIKLTINLGQDLDMGTRQCLKAPSLCNEKSLEPPRPS